MRRWNAELERREAIRMPRRLACVVWVGSKRYEGVLEQASAHAVVVRMKEVPTGSHEARLTFSTPNGVNLALRAMPVRRDVVAHTRAACCPASIVLRVREPTDAYLRWLDVPVVGVP